MPFTDSINMVDVIISDKSSLNATPSDVLTNKQFIGSTKKMEYGSIPINPIKSNILIVAGESLDIPYGFNPTSYNVIAKDLSEETPGTASSDEIVEGKTAWVNGEKITGSLLNVGTETDELLCGAIHQISRGFHDGNGYIKAIDLASQTAANISDFEIIEGKDCWANGKRIVGTMPKISSESITLLAGESYNIPYGFHDEYGIIRAASLSAQTQGNASSETLVRGYSAWVNGEKITGNMNNNGSVDIILPFNGTYEIPNGYHSGFGKVSQQIPSKDGQTVAPGRESQTIATAGYYMEGDIIVTGIDALNYIRNKGIVNDSSGNPLDQYELVVENNKSNILLYLDNWHDNSTANIYNIIFDNLIDADGNNIDINTIIMIDWKQNETLNYKYGLVELSIGIDSTSGSQKITISNIISGKITVIEKMSLREL